MPRTSYRSYATQLALYFVLQHLRKYAQNDWEHLGWLHSAYSARYGVEVNHDQEGGSSKVRLFHCTSVELTLTITPNVGNLNASFLLVGDCVRAIPLQIPWDCSELNNHRLQRLRLRARNSNPAFLPSANKDGVTSVKLIWYKWHTMNKLSPKKSLVQRLLIIIWLRAYIICLW